MGLNAERRANPGLPPRSPAPAIFQLSKRALPRHVDCLMEPLQALSRFIFLCVLLTGPVAWGLVVLFKRRWGRGYDGAVEASSEEILEELDREFTPLRRTTIRTQTEYLPFLFECIRENIDSGFEDPQMGFAAGEDRTAAAGRGAQREVHRRLRRAKERPPSALGPRLLQPDPASYPRRAGDHPRAQGSQTADPAGRDPGGALRSPGHGQETRPTG